jgi:hypothetical protein
LKFSERIGKKSIKAQIQIQSMDQELRAALWNCLQVSFFEKYVGPSDTQMILAQMSASTVHRHNVLGNLQDLFRELWGAYFKQPLDTLPNNFYNALGKVREYFFKSEWYEVYDIIEFIAQATPALANVRFMGCCNQAMEMELSGYRFVGAFITPITDNAEIAQIEEVLEFSQATKLSGVHSHIESALSKLSDRKNPDYRNSIKESISAVEAIAQIIAKKPTATLADALKIIEDKIGLHSALKKGFLSIYGYTSDADGIRHALADESKCDFEDAKYMLVSCSAFVNYLMMKAVKAGQSF